MRVVIVGAGGIGTYLLDPLLRFLSFQFKGKGKIRVNIIDGKNYEGRKRERQAFSRWGNKAEVKVEEFAEIFPNIRFTAVSDFITRENAYRHIQEKDIVFVCVDNHKTRLVISERACELDDVVVISGGNELTDGNVRVHVRADGEDLTLPLANHHHPEIMYPEDRSPEEIGCDERVEIEPQLVPMNNLVAAQMVATFYVLLQDRVEYNNLFIDMMTGHCQAIMEE